MVITLSIIIVLLLIVIYYLYTQNRRPAHWPSEEVSKKVVEEHEEEQMEDQTFESIYDVLKNKKVTKSDVIHIINISLGRRELSNANTNFSSLNKAKPVWWFDILPEKFSEDLHLILGKEEGFIWITIPKDAVTDVNKVFRVRDDNGRVQLVISSEPGVYYLRDIASGASGFNFEQYVEKIFD